MGSGQVGHTVEVWYGVVEGRAQATMGGHSLIASQGRGQQDHEAFVSACHAWVHDRLIVPPLG